MNEIKIRIYNKENRKMLYPKTLQELLLIERNNGAIEKIIESTIYRISKLSEDRAKVEYNYLEFMLYTGKKDIKGNEIYEGDIIKGYWIIGREEFIGRIEYDENECTFQVKGLSQFLYLLEITNLEIIGNIYENDK